MTNKKDNALKLALGYMDGTLVTDHLVGYERKRYVMEAIREALAEQPAQQEPVIDKSAAIRIATALGWAPSKPWVGLTDEERNNLWRDVIGWGDPSHDDEDLMKAIEAKLKEKNA